MAKDNKLKQVITKVIVRILIWCVSTLRYDRKKRPAKPCIVALWHEDISTACRFFSNYDTVTLASPSRDAENLSVPVLIANNITQLRYTASKPDLATQGIYEIMKYKENCLALTIDGPSGPRRKSKAGVLILAARLGIPLYACRFSYRHFRLKSSWDKTKIPLPFTKIHAHISEPILLNRKSNIRSELTKLDKLMLELADD